MNASASSCLHRLGLVAAGSMLLLAVILWIDGLLDSPLIEARRAEESAFITAHLSANARDQGQERLLAEGYWRRYRDVRLHPYWGENGPLGIHGPRHHYRQHGRREGRFLSPLAIPKDLEIERILAESYWQRYPEVRDSWIWGEQADLGILGPRDHYIHVGSGLGYQWGTKKAPEDQPPNNSSRKLP